MSKPRDVARILGRTEAANPSNLALSLDGSTEPTTQYDSIGLLPVTGLIAGTQAFVTSTNRLYVSNGSGWYNTALINATPALSLSSSGTITLASDGSPTTITMTATDSDNSDANLVLSLESGGDLFKFATVSQDSSVVTITPRTEDSAVALGYDGSATLTFKASDGINQATVQNTFTLSFGPNWSVAPTESKITASDAAGGDQFGESVSISADGNYAIVGALEEEAGGSNAGAAYIYVRSGSTWTQQQKIISSDIAANDQFGTSVSISSDGTYAIVGSLEKDAGYYGSAYIFTRSGSTWTQQQKITPSDAANSDYFGTTVSISSDGTYAIIGAYAKGTVGAAYIFNRSGSTWTQQQKIQASDAQQYDNFGFSVSINSDGTYAIVGAIGEDTTAVGAGAAYIYTRSGSTWTQQQKIQASNAGGGDGFGISVSMSADGNYAIVGANAEDGNGDTITNAGAAYIFSRSGSTWTEQALLRASDAVSFWTFGEAVSINSDGTYAIVGAWQASYEGAAYIYSRSGSTWTQERKITASDVASGDRFGYSVSTSSDSSYVIAGAYIKNGSAGAAYIYEAG
jgi:hypothetical protein